MTQNGFLLHFFDKNYILRTFFIILALSMLLIVDFFIAIKLISFVGGFLLLFLLSISGFAGLFLGFLRVKFMLANIMNDVNAGTFNIKELYGYFGSIIGCILLIIPGFFTDFLGIIFLASILKTAIGKLVLKPHEDSLRTLYEYLKLY